MTGAPDCPAAKPRPIPTAALSRPMGAPGGARDAAGRIFRTAAELAAVTLAAVGIMAVCIGLARAHEARSGWAYPRECCSGRDCREVPAEALEPTPQGWRIRATGEIWPYERTLPFGDGRWHICQIGGRPDGKALCVFAPGGV